MPGHTHEDIDQYFSVLSRYLRPRSCWTYEEFVSEVERAFKTANYIPKLVERVNLNHNFASWLHKYRDPKFSGFGEYRVYRCVWVCVFLINYLVLADLNG